MELLRITLVAARDQIEMLLHFMTIKDRQELIQKNISKANDCDRGLAAYLFTTDYAQVLPLIQEIQNL